ncbi:HAMP domain-containing histidine kinase (plasmid) [Alkalihalobacillus hwajinpoensis]|uniref:sensor histidine kinase n=1 Tax=Guptibacillus hwajinpoensis TaxID=208199 RepID=UPI0018838D67|nr:HAMP domain-containing sensor histidine kinase [Pseudalkalibacillus hwajinpoensis]MBF0706561.1 HAMP domain-containing histidine kinase [Pseudalkalibacillus hwajinpoensis]
MKWDKIVLKLGGIIMILFLVVLLPLGFVVNQIFSGFYFNEIQEETEVLSQRYARTIKSIENPMTHSMFESLADLTNKEVIILNKEKKEVTNSGVSGFAISEGEFNELLSGNPITKQIEEIPNKHKFYVSGHPISTSGDFIGAVFVLTSVDGIYDSISKVRNFLILSGFGALFLALGFTFMISRKMSAPLLKMEKATRQLTRGNLDVRLEVSSRDEIGSLSQAINDLAQELNRYRTNRREFFADISHELRTPISYLQGYAQVLREGYYQNNDEKQQYLKIIQDESNRLTQLINDVFELSKMEEARIDLNFDYVNISEIAEQALSKVQREAQIKGLNTSLRVTNHLPLIKADSVRMEQIFINLLSNAIRYSNEGLIKVEIVFNHKYLKVDIADNGIGIPKEELPYIFERFHRVEKSRSRDFGGTGLGLAIVKQLVELQNGSITVDSQIGNGTRFTLSFPIEEENYEKI